MRSFEIYSTLRQTDVLLSAGCTEASASGWKTHYASARASQARLIGELYVSCLDEGISPPDFISAALVGMAETIHTVAMKDLSMVMARLGANTPDGANHTPGWLGKIISQIMVLLGYNPMIKIGTDEMTAVAGWLTRSAQDPNNPFKQDMDDILVEMGDLQNRLHPYKVDNLEIIRHIQRRLIDLMCHHGRRPNETCEPCNAERTTSS